MDRRRPECHRILDPDKSQVLKATLLHGVQAGQVIRLLLGRDLQVMVGLVIGMEEKDRLHRLRGQKLEE